jgi:bacteriocin-like protein
MQSLLALETPEAGQSALRGREVELSVDEIKAIREILMKKLDSGEELSEEELAEVNGGVYLALTAGAILLMMALGAGTGAAIGGLGAVVTGAAVLAANLTNNTW